jgi:uncharacterized protein (DUF983 family)
MTHAPSLPRSLWQAAKRGVSGRCPRCGEGRLFRAFLKPIDRCACCGVDWTPQRADDFPAYVSILITGHLITPLVMYLVLGTDMDTGAITAIVLPLTVLLMLATLQPAKGAVIAMQWWNGMHGFVRERRPRAL